MASSVNVSPLLDQLLQSLQAQAAAEATARQTGQQVPWMMPPLNNWNGDMTDLVGMGTPFDRSGINQELTAALQNAGVVGDLALANAQVDLLAILQRSFRARHSCDRIRMLAHMSGRKAGHGNPAGPLIACTLGYLQNLSARAKVQQS